MIDGLIAGRIYGQAKTGVGKNGSAYVTAKVRAVGVDGAPVLVNVITFSDSVGQALMALADGESVALSGALTTKLWTDRDGLARPGLDMQAHAFLSVASGRRRPAGETPPEDGAAGR